MRVDIRDDGDIGEINGGGGGVRVRVWEIERGDKWRRQSARAEEATAT